MATRPLNSKELALAEFLLKGGSDEAGAFLPQLAAAQATDWRCPCGCARFNLKIGDWPEAPPGVTVLGDFLFGAEESLAGVFIYESGGTLSGVEIYGLAGEAPHQLPDPSELRPMDVSSTAPVA